MITGDLPQGLVVALKEWRKMANTGDSVGMQDYTEEGKTTLCKRANDLLKEEGSSLRVEAFIKYIKAQGVIMYAVYLPNAKKLLSDSWEDLDEAREAAQRAAKRHNCDTQVVSLEPEFSYTHELTERQL